MNWRNELYELFSYLHKWILKRELSYNLSCGSYKTFRFIFYQYFLFFTGIHISQDSRARKKEYHSFTPHLQFKVHKYIARVAGDNSKHLIPT